MAATIIVSVATMALAQDKAKAREAYRLATQHYDLGEYDRALESFKEAYRNFEDPLLLFNIAQCYRQIGNNQNAVREYRMYLLKFPEASNRLAVLELIAKLEKALADEQANKSMPPAGTAAPVDSRATAPSRAPALSKAVMGEPLPTPPDFSRATPPVVVAPQSAIAGRPRMPLYKRWWLWTAVGAAVVAVVGVGVGVGVSRSGTTPTANTALGTFRF